MEEWVGNIWHKFISQQTSNEFNHARVELEQVIKSVTLIFRALGGDPGKRIEAAAPRDYLVRRSLVQRIAGSHQQFSLAWQDDTSLRLPESIAIFPRQSLNKDLYVWLAALAAHSPVRFSHWAKDNQYRVNLLLNLYPQLAQVYHRLVVELLAKRPDITSLPQTQQPLEQAIQQALIFPDVEVEFSHSNYAPLPVYVWLYPNANVDAVPLSEQDRTLTDEKSHEQDPNQQQSKQARKKTQRILEPESKDSLMVFRLESLFSWSEFSKVNRAQDDSDNDDAKQVAEDLDVLALMQNSQQRSARLKMDMDLPAAIEDDLPLGDGIKLPEWNYKTQTLIPDRCLLQAMLPRGSKAQTLPRELQLIAKKIRQQFASLMSLKQWKNAQPQGQEIDFTAWLDFHIESQISETPERGLYRHLDPSHRDISCLILSDISMSTAAYIDNDKQIIDVIKHSLLLFAEALDGIGDNFAMYGFSSVKRHHIRFSILKNFAEPYTDMNRGRILQLKPGFYTRMGAAIRQATDILNEQQSSKKLLLILTDGKPNDLDHYEGRFGIEDSKQAILATKRLGILPFCITIDQQANQYLPYIFGSHGFTVIHDPAQLPSKLPLLYHQLTQQ